MKKIIGIDYGTANTFIYVLGRGIVFTEPTVIAINTKTKKTVEIGYLASKLIGRANDDVDVIKPVQRGVPARINPSVNYLSEALRRSGIKSLKNYSVLFATPSDVTPVEKMAYVEILKRLGGEDILFEDQAKLATLGSGVSFKEGKGTMHINLGAGVSNIIIMSNSEIILSKSTFFCGNLIDESILRYLRKQRHLLIGVKTAEFIKMKIGSVELNPENRLLEVSGRDILTSLPHNVTISTNEVKNIIMPLVELLIDAINDVLLLTPPEITSDIKEMGVVISGGTSLLAGMREYIEKSINIPVRIAPDPIACVANGMKQALKNNLN